MSFSIASGFFKGRKLASPPSSITRPTSSLVRDALFNSLQTAIDDAEFLDLFAGSGAMGLEALSRGAKAATFVESHRLAIASIKKNIETFNVAEKCSVISQKSEKALEALEKKDKTFDIIFADPPYAQKELYDDVIRFIDQKNILKKSGVFCIEAPIDFEAPLLERLKSVRSKRYGSTKLIFYTL